MIYSVFEEHLRIEIIRTSNLPSTNKQPAITLSIAGLRKIFRFWSSTSQRLRHRHKRTMDRAYYYRYARYSHGEAAPSVLIPTKDSRFHVDQSPFSYASCATREDRQIYTNQVHKVKRFLYVSALQKLPFCPSTLRHLPTHGGCKGLHRRHASTSCPSSFTNISFREHSKRRCRKKENITQRFRLS